MNTTWDPDNLRPEDYPDYESWWEEREFFTAWLDRYFAALGAPSAKGGLESINYSDQFFMCRECSALILTDGSWSGRKNPNLHRAWHDQINSN